MDPVTAVLIPGILGGLAFAWLISRVHGRGARSLAEAPMDGSRAADINISRIRAAGVGGLGLLAMGLVVAWFVPRIGLTLGVGALLGAALGAVIIVLRRRNGPLPTSSGSAGANVVLSIDQPAASKLDDTGDKSSRLQVAVPRRAV
jgi:hypothetical protein